MSGLFDEGAGDLDSNAFQEKLDEVGAEMRFSSTRDGIYGTVRVLAEDKDAAFDLLRLAIEKPRFDQGPVDRIRSQLLTGIDAAERDPNDQARKQWARAVYGEHPYARPDEGTKESLAGLSTDDLHAFHDSQFARDGLYVAVVGAIDAETLKRDLDRLFGNLPEKQKSVPVAHVQPKLDQQLKVAYDLPQTSIQMAFPGLERTATRSDRAAETVEVIRSVIRQMAQEGPTEAELEAARKYLIGAYAINNLNSSGAIASTLVELQVTGLGKDYIERRPALLEAVTVADVKKVAAKLLSGEPAVMLVGPDVEKVPAE
jgi:zinc protease